MVNENSATSDRLRLLTVFASPVANEEGNRPSGATLDVWGEWEALQAALTLRDPVTGAGTPWDVVRLSPPTAEALGDELARNTARVVHLAGHGCPAGLVFEDDLGRERLVPTAELIRHLRGRGVDLVVLNACDTAALAGELVAAGVAKAVVAMREPIYDREAALLAGRLYARLGAGDTLSTALSAARESLKERIRSAHPVLGLGNKDPEVRAANWLIVGDGGLRLRSPGEPAGTARLHRLTTPANDPLPFGKLRGFVGRHEELYRLAEWLASPGGRIFVIHGVGGVGKTTLALNAALRASHRFDAFAWASAKDIPELGALAALGAVAAATGWVMQPEESTQPGAALTRRLNGQRVLLVLDNFESVAEPQARELAQVVEGLEPGCGSRVLVTLRPKDRSPLTNGVPKRERIHLETLDLPSALARAFAEVLREEAPNPPAFTAAPDPEVREAARLAGLDHLPPAWLVALGRLATGAAGHPILVDLAAASVGQVGWESALQRLGGLRGSDLEERLEQMIGQMVDALERTNPDALTVLHATRLFPSGALPRHLEWVAVGALVENEDERITWEDGARRAALDSSLLRFDGEHFDLDPPVRRYLEVRRRLEPEAERTLRLRQGRAFAECIRVLNELWLKSEISLAAIPEWQNLMAGWLWLADAGITDEEGARLLVEQTWNWQNLLMYSPGPHRRRLLEAAVAAAGHVGSRLGEANTRKALGDLERFESRLPEAREHFEAALELFRHVGDRLGEANTRQELGDLERFESRLPKAREHLEAALELFRHVGSRLGEAKTRKALGDLERFEDRLPEAREHFEAALDLFRHVGDRLGEANTRQALGDLEGFEDRLPEALEHFEAALDLFRHVGDRLGEAKTRKALGDLEDRLPEARSHFDAALDLFRSVGSRLGEANTVASLALLALRETNDEQAGTLLELALETYRRIGDRYSVPAQTGNFGWVLLELGRDQEARTYLLAAAAEFEALGYTERAARHRSAAEAIPVPLGDL